MLNKILLVLAMVAIILLGYLGYKLYELKRVADCYGKSVTEMPKYCWELIETK